MVIVTISYTEFLKPYSQGYAVSIGSYPVNFGAVGVGAFNKNAFIYSQSQHDFAGSARFPGGGAFVNSYIASSVAPTVASAVASV